MTDLRRPISSLAVLVLLLAACGGGGGGNASAGPTDGTAAEPTQETTSEAPADATPATEQPGGGVGPAADVCGLVTADELAGIFGVSSVTLEVFKGPPDTCDIQTGGAPLAATVLTTENSSLAFDALAASPDSVKVAGLGDRAIYSPSSLLLLVQKGDSMISIAVLDDQRPEEERLDLMKKIGAIAAGRM